MKTSDPKRVERTQGRRGVSRFLVLMALWSWVALPAAARTDVDHNKQPMSSSSIAAKPPEQTAQETSLRVADASGYLIGPEDVLAVSVWKNPELSQEEMVRPDGKIALKLVGEIPVAGLTVQDVRLQLTQRYREFVPAAEVAVTLKEMNSFKVYVMGRVTKPGEYKVRSDLTVMQALALAGGFTVYAREKKIKVFRQRPGKDEILTFNYRKAIKGDAPDIALRPGDRVVVP